MSFSPLLLVNGSIYRIYQIIFVFTAISVANASNVYFSRENIKVLFLE